MKKKKWWIRVLLFIVPMIIKNQKGIKGTKKEKIVDDFSDLLEKPR